MNNEMRGSGNENEDFKEQPKRKQQNIAMSWWRSNLQGPQEISMGAILRWGEHDSIQAISASGSWTISSPCGSRLKVSRVGCLLVSGRVMHITPAISAFAPMMANGRTRWTRRCNYIWWERKLAFFNNRSPQKEVSYLALAHHWEIIWILNTLSAK